LAQGPTMLSPDTVQLLLFTALIVALIGAVLP
jgi:hypothetical protein